MAAATKYSFKQLEAIWVAAGGDRPDAGLMASIALAESAGDPAARNPSGATGLWQIMLPVNSHYIPGGAANATNPIDNAKAAVAIVKSQGLHAWETFTNGAYKQYYTVQNLKSGIALEKGVEPQAGILGILEGKIPGFSKESKGEEKAEETVKSAASGLLGGVIEIVLKGVLLLAGAVLVIYGIMVAVRPPDRALSLPKAPMVLPV